ncbi:hypothetical protein [Dolichospermum sp. UHCC 0259]|uniref:hypothetical protein n=1 Tax=Dolichospermum sp. UHCC 0259 TaxID=2590010 RepID=UPI001446DAD7|nr:hypothetical protein [Dolichospermum sp. UHCC 0259]MTJ50541.1 hypothetical protein [Dolichospermum sp. UHCC 0259]
MSKLPDWKDLPDWSKTIFIVSVVVVAGVTGVSVPTLLKSTDSTKEEPPKEIPTPTTPNPESQKIGIYVKNNTNSKPIEGAEVKLEPSHGSPETKKTNEDGYTSFTVLKGVKINVIITKEKFKMKDKIYNEAIDPTENKIYYLTPETDISSVKPSSSSLLITGTSPPTSTPKPSYIPPIKPSPSVIKTAPLASKTSTPKPSYIPPIKPSPIPVTKPAPPENSNNLELALLDRFTIDVFF